MPTILMINTEELYTKAFQNILSRYGKEYTFEFKLTLMGLQGHEVAQKVVSKHNLPLTPEEFSSEAKKLFEVYFPETKLMPGVERLLRHLKKHKVPIGLATSSSIESYHMKTDKHHQEIFSLFDYKTFGSSDPEVKRGKPYPDTFLVAAGKFPDKPMPEKCLVFEDAVNGVKSALAAGMQVVMVPDPRLSAEMTKEATLVLRSLEEFKPELFGLPAFD
ncbi:probable pseudouridine-5'-phosphatase isoform X2 [Aricia agestis]|uniref:probable pseudouridine-5'-phosphatase isoform X2 n=1 Tax=Aricia agestis TaxID=91739 RepID=UPI001C20A2FD|nr:probable pseudouridine-5'-phosphatase isoform X2 [Aricia agestis]